MVSSKFGRYSQKSQFRLAGYVIKKLSEPLAMGLGYKVNSSNTGLFPSTGLQQQPLDWHASVACCCFAAE